MYASEGRKVTRDSLEKDYPTFKFEKFLYIRKVGMTFNVVLS